MESNFNDPYESAALHETAAKKHILFVVTQSELGGAQQFLVRLLQHLNRKQFAVTVVVGADGQDEIRSVLPSEIHYIKASHLHRTPHIFKEDWQAIFEIRRIILDTEADMIFLMSSKAGFIGQLASWLVRRTLPKLNVLYRIGGWTFNDPWPTWKKQFYILLERFSARWKDYIIVNSKKDYDDAQRLHITPRKKLLVIHNGIDPYMEFLNREEARIKIFEKIARQNFENNTGGQAALFHAKSIIGTVANFYPPKGLSILLDATVRDKNDTLYIIIGDGHLRPNLEDQITRLGLEKKVYLIGKLPNAYQYLPAFDVCVLPSIKEGFPWFILESMAAKVPVIATSVGAVPEIVEDGVSGLIVPPHDSAALSQAIHGLIDNEGLRREFAIQAHQRLIKLFSLQHMVDQYEDLFNSL